MIVQAGLVIDLGNSGTRVKLILNKKSELLEMSNKFAELAKGYEVPEVYEDSETSLIEVGGIRFANGELADKEFSASLLRPSALQPKVELVTTQLSLNLIFAKALERISVHTATKLSDIDATFKVTILLPPLEQDVKKEVMKEKVKEISKVVMHLPISMSMDFKVSDVLVIPEGVAAYFGALFREVDGKLEIVPDNAIYQTGYVLIVDIGAGTTDVAIIRDGKLIEDSKDTFKKGGNSIESSVRNEIKKKYGYSPRDLGAVICRCELDENGTINRIPDLVNVAKSRFSRSLMEDIKQYLERMMIDMKEIKGTLIVGGGTLESETVDENQKPLSPALADELNAYFKELAPNIKAVSTDGKNKRLLNIEGAEIVHKHMSN
ncbi:MreB/Mbl protein [compost metagenome]